MIIQCENCNVKLNLKIDPSQLPPMGKKITCPKCKHIILVKPPIKTPVTTSIETIQCTFCNVKLKVPIDKIPAPGTKLKCPKCKRVFIVGGETKSKIEEIAEPEAIYEEIFPQLSDPEILPPPTSKEIEIKKTTILTVSPKTLNDLSPEDKKKHKEARRFARILVSDIILYNQEKIEQGLRNNNIMEILGTEINQSWQLYKQQISENITSITDYFCEAVNQIIGKGEKIL